MTSREKLLAYGSWVAVCVIWGTTYLAIRVAVRTIPDALLSAMRFTIAGALMLVFVRLRGERLPPLSQWKHVAVVAICLIGIGNWLVVWAENFVPSGPTALLVATLPFWMVFEESVIARRAGWIPGTSAPVDTAQLAGLCIGFGGVLLLVFPELQGGWDRRFLLGVVLLQVASASWAAGSLYSKYRKIDCGPLANASLQMLIGGLFLSVVALVRGDLYEVQWDRTGILAGLYLLVAGSMIAYVCYIYALSKLPSSFVSLYGYINPLIAVWLGWLILDEQVTWITILATAVILAGSWIVRKK